MKIAYFDCSSGLCGSMIVGAFLDAGLSLELLQSKLALLKIPGLNITVRKVWRKSLWGSLMRVHDSTGDHPVDLLRSPRKGVDSESPSPERASKPLNIIGIVNRQGDNHSGHIHRNLQDIEDILRDSALDLDVVEEVVRIFTRLAKAEARVHGTTAHAIHFHEVGALDAIADIVCAVVGRQCLGIEQIFSSAVAVGNGTIKCHHGVLPVPAPATAELLMGVPLQTHLAQTELTTPTGAAILTEWAHAFGPMPSMTIETIGYGAGEKDMSHPNLLRVFIGNTSTKTDIWERDSMVQIETHLDDTIPEDLPIALQRILEAGAVDAVVAPVVFKKGRSGHALTVLCATEFLAQVAEAIFRHTAAIGLRHFPVSRLKLIRSIEEVSTSYGQVTGKKVERTPGCFTFKPEYEDCRKLAEKNGVSVQAVRLEAEISWRSNKENSDV